MSSNFTFEVESVLNTFQSSSNQSLANPLLSHSGSQVRIEDAGPQFDASGTYTNFPTVSSDARTNELSEIIFSDSVVYEEGGVRPIFKNSEGELHDMPSFSAPPESN